MQKGLMIFFITFILFGMLMPAGFVVATSHDTDSNSGSGSGSDSSRSSDSTTDATTTDSADSDDDSDNSSDEETDEAEEEEKDEADEADDDETDRKRIKEKIEKERDRIRERFESDVRNADGSRIRIERFIEVDGDEVKVKIRQRITNSDGTEIDRTIVIERDEDSIKRKIKIEGIDDLEVETELEIDDEIGENESDVAVITSDGNETEIRVLPDRARDIALKRLKALNITKIELKERIHNNIPRVVYNIETNKDGKFLGIFKLKLKVEGEVDPETGEFIGTSKPWWAFLVSGEDSDQTSTESGEGTVTDETSQ